MKYAMIKISIWWNSGMGDMLLPVFQKSPVRFLIYIYHVHSCYHRNTVKVHTIKMAVQWNPAKGLF